MYSEELPGFFRIQVPLPGNPLKELNAWLVKGKRRHLLIDNGFNMSASEKALRGAFAALEIDAADLDFFITHLHSDHNGLTHKLASKNALVYAGRLDGEKINNFIARPQLWKEALSVLVRHGFPPGDLDALVSSHPGNVYASSEPLDFTWIEDGDELEYGDYVFSLVATPGHTPGHFLLHEKGRGFLISGDHILGGITPNITCWPGVPDSLGDYLASLDKIVSLNAGKAYPGHRAVVENVNVRAKELRIHHIKRLAEAVSIVHKLGSASGWAVAERMLWNLRGEWRRYPVPQKCFAVGETIAHLDHLALIGEICKENASDGNIIYRG